MLLQADQLHKRYGTHIALKSLHFSVKAGEIFALLGPNGAGKTTTINCFLGFAQPDAGRAIINSIEVAEEPEQARQLLGYIPEQVNLYGWMTGHENLLYFAELGGQSLSKEKCFALLAEAGLQEEAFNKRLSGYSKGMRQKVGIAIALAKQAQVLLLDEPTSGLDPSASNEFSQLLTKLSSDGVAVLMATHDIFRAHEVANRIGIMRAGELVDEFPAYSITASELESKYLQAMQTV